MFFIQKTDVDRDMAGKYFLDIANESGKTSVPIVLKVLGKFKYFYVLHIGIIPLNSDFFIFNAQVSLMPAKGRCRSPTRHLSALACHGNRLETMADRR